MTPCKGCNKEESKVFYSNTDGCWYCRTCYTRPPDRAILSGVMHYWEDGKGSISAAHLDDIKHRKYDFESKEVKRDTGRRYI